MRTGNKGLTIIELLIGLGVMALITFMAAGAMTLLKSRTTELNKKLEGEIDHDVAERVIMEDLRQSTPSFNLILQNDDNDRRFFDYEPERPQSSFSEDALRRKLTLDIGKDRNEIFLVQQDVQKGPVLVYNPVDAYTVGEPPADVNKPADLKFSTLNKLNAITRNRPKFWRDGRLLMLDTPAMLRPVLGGMLDMNTPPRSPVLIGRVRGLDLLPVQEINDRIFTTEPIGGTEVGDADRFLRRVPSVGGGQPVVRIRAVRFLRYALERKANVAGPPRGQLVRYSLDDEGKETSFLVADDVVKVVFERPNITQKLIYFRLIRPEALKKEEKKEEQGGSL